MGLSRWKQIEMRSVIALTLHDSNVQNAPMIYRAASFCIFFISLRE